MLHGHGRWSYRLLEVLNGEAIPVILADGWQLPLDAWPRCRWQMLFGFFGCFAWDEVNQKWLLNWNAICILEISDSVIDLKLFVFLIYLLYILAYTCAYFAIFIHMKYIYIYTILFLYRRSVVFLHLDSDLWWQSSKDELIHWDQISLRRSEELSMDPAALVETWCLLLKLKRLINC